MRLEKNKTDYIVAGTALIVVLVFVALFWINGGSKENKVNVYYNNNLIYTMHRNVDETLVLRKDKYPDLLADMTITVSGGKVRVLEEESPKHYCSLMGEQSASGVSIICAPNHVRITIEGYEDVGIDYQPGGVN